MLADDGDSIGVPVFDEHTAVPVEDHAARRPQRERPLVVVFRHFLELLILRHLQHPEADGQDEEDSRNEVLKCGQPDTQPAAILLSPFIALAIANPAACGSWVPRLPEIVKKFTDAAE